MMIYKDTTKEEIQARVDDLQAQVDPLLKELDELNQRLLEMSSPFKVGDEIAWNGGKRRGRVLSIRRWYGNECSWVVRNIRKDGSEGSKQTVYSYQVKE